MNTLVELYFVPVGQPEDIGISNKVDSWDPDEDFIVKVPSGTSATVIGAHKYIYPEGEMIRYKVKVVHNGREFMGWVFSDQIRTIN